MKLKMSRPTAKKREQYLKVLTTYLEDFDNYQYILFSVNYCKTMLNNGKWDAADLINKKLKDVGDVIYDDILRRSKKHWDEIKLRAEHRHSRKDFLKPSAKDNQ